MELATFIGITITEFWEITPKELDFAFKSYRKRKQLEAEEYNIKFKNQQDLAITQAWLTANWARAKRMPNLDKVLGSKKATKVMSNDEMLKQVQLLNNLFGGEVDTVGKE